jgi:hypothetical protein
LEKNLPSLVENLVSVREWVLLMPSLNWYNHVLGHVSERSFNFGWVLVCRTAKHESSYHCDERTERQPVFEQHDTITSTRQSIHECGFFI